MRGHLTLLFGLAVSFFGSTQVVYDYTLGLNNADALITDGGVFFNDEAAGSPGFAIPSGSQLNTIFSMAFWYGGVDANGQLKLSAQQYENLADQFKGPLTLSGEIDASTQLIYSLYAVTQDEISFHLANYLNPGYVPLSNVVNWPAHGDVSINQDYYLAPFVDVDGDGNYNAMAGDYPCIRGDQAVFLIMNDKGNVHASGGDPLGIEMHYMFYEYDESFGDLANTIFVYGKVINRGTQTIQDFKTSVFMDGDIGYSGDDYFGSDSTRNLMYFYNGDNFDESAAGTAGYQMAPPAAGIVSLTHDFESMGFVEDAAVTASGYWNAMNAMTNNSVTWAHPGSFTPIKFMYPDDPSDPSQPYSEVAQGNPPGDRKGIATINFGTLTPSAVFEFDFAVLYNQEFVDNVDNAVGIKTVADNVQAFFDATVLNDCIGSVVAINELTPVEFSIFPNPSNGEFTLALDAQFSNAEVEIFDVTGRRVLETLKLTDSKTNIRLFESTGVYLLHLTIDGQKSIQRIILE